MKCFCLIALDKKFELILMILFLFTFSNILAKDNFNRKNMRKMENIDVNFRNLTKNETSEFYPDFNEESSAEKITIKNFSIMISVIWMILGFIISTLFFLIALLLIKKI
jgi:hypothetical protein